MNVEESWYNNKWNKSQKMTYNMTLLFKKLSHKNKKWAFKRNTLYKISQTEKAKDGMILLIYAM